MADRAARLDIPNAQARHLWLAAHGLARAPVGTLDVPQIIRDLGFLQIDTIRNVTRAHNHILWSRNRKFREGQLWPLLQGRQLFEHFTHDASLIPSEILPLWQVQFARLGAKARAWGWHKSGLDEAEFDRIRARIRAEGPLSTHAFNTKSDSREMWARPPHKKALDQMWYAGDLATCHRENFIKFYDLSERVFAPCAAMSDAAALAALNDMALDKMAMASAGEVQRFWGVATAAEVKHWAADAQTVPIRVQSADGRWTDGIGAPDIAARLEALPPLAGQMRLLNPFDPAIRDRARLERLFGFAYRNEMFVPAAKRRWGYYVYPLLEGDRFVGRIEVKGDRAAGEMTVIGFWPEEGCAWGAGRRARLEAELSRFARMAGLDKVIWRAAATP